MPRALISSGGGGILTSRVIGLQDPWAALDGRLLAPAGTPQFPTILNKYGTGSAFAGAPVSGRYRWPNKITWPSSGNFIQPQQMVPGVDYYVGIDQNLFPNNTGLTPAASGVLPSGVTRSGNNITISGNNVTFNGWDFTGFNVQYQQGVQNLVFSNCLFYGSPGVFIFRPVAAGSFFNLINSKFINCTVDGGCGSTTATGTFGSGVTSITLADTSRIKAGWTVWDLTASAATNGSTGITVASVVGNTVNLNSPLAGTITSGDTIIYGPVPNTPSGCWQWFDDGMQIVEYCWIRHIFQVPINMMPVSNTQQFFRYNVIENVCYGTLINSSAFHGDWMQNYWASGSGFPGTGNANLCDISFNLTVMNDPALNNVLSQGYSVYSASNNAGTCQSLVMHGNVCALQLPSWCTNFGLLQSGGQKTAGSWLAAIEIFGTWIDMTGVEFLNPSGTNTGWSNFTLLTNGPFLNVNGTFSGSLAGTSAINISLLDGKTLPRPAGQ